MMVVILMFTLSSFCQMIKAGVFSPEVTLQDFQLMKNFLLTLSKTTNPKITIPDITNLKINIPKKGVPKFSIPKITIPLCISVINHMTNRFGESKSSTKKKLRFRKFDS